MNYLEILNNNRKEWGKYLLKMGAHESNIDDLVQEMYLRCHKYNLESKVIKNGKANKTYCWYILRTVFHASLTQAKRMPFVDFDVMGQAIQGDDYDNVKEDAFEEFRMKLYSEIDNLDKEGVYPYNKNMFLLYVESGLSMRLLSKETGISVANIFNTLRHCKDVLRGQVREDFEDLINEDYELIK